VEATIQMEGSHTKLFDTDESILNEIMRADKKLRSGNLNALFPIVDVFIPQTITIDCPTARPMLCSANKCKECTFFKGVVQTAWSDDQEIAWSAKYAIRCGFELDRKTRQLVIE